MLIYADICTLCRPFDGQSQPRIWLETHALCIVLNLAETGQINMARSPIHDLENSRNPKEFRRLWVDQCLSLATHRVALIPAIKQRAPSNLNPSVSVPWMRCTPPPLKREVVLTCSLAMIASAKATKDQSPS